MLSVFSQSRVVIPWIGRTWPLAGRDLIALRLHAEVFDIQPHPAPFSPGLLTLIPIMVGVECSPKLQSEAYELNTGCDHCKIRKQTNTHKKQIVEIDPILSLRNTFTSLLVKHA
jgi:hypothetical protein